MDGNGALFGTLQGNTRDVLHKFTVDLPKKHGRGGQSALRFARLRYLDLLHIPLLLCGLLPLQCKHSFFETCCHLSGWRNGTTMFAKLRRLLFKCSSATTSQTSLEWSWPDRQTSKQNSASQICSTQGYRWGIQWYYLIFSPLTPNQGQLHSS